MNTYQRQSFKKALEHSHTTLKLSKKLRETNYPSKSKMLKDFSKTWSIYEDLFSIMRNLLSTSKGELKTFFTGCYESYLNDYKLLKSDMGDLLTKNEALKPLIPKDNTENLTSNSPKKKQKIFVNYIKKIAEFEYENVLLLKSNKPERITYYFATLNQLYTSLFNFVKNVFEVAEKCQNFNFYLSENIKISWQIMTIIDKGNLVNWNKGREEEEKIAVEIGNIYYKLKLSNDTYPSSGGNTLQTFTKCVQRLSQYSKTQNLKDFYQGNIELVSDLLEKKTGDDDGLIGFFTKIVKSGSDVDYKNLEKNKYLLTLRNLVHSTLTSLEILMKNNEQISQCYYEMSFFYQFLKRYVVKSILVEFYKRVVIYDKVKRDLILI